MFGAVGYIICHFKMKLVEWDCCRVRIRVPNLFLSLLNTCFTTKQPRRVSAAVQFQHTLS